MPNAYQRLQIAVHSGVSPKTVLKACKGKPVRSSIAARINAAAQLLRLTLPQIVVVAERSER